MTLQVNALGSFDVLSESRASLTFPTTKAKILFAHFALEAGTLTPAGKPDKLMRDKPRKPISLEQG